MYFPTRIIGINCCLIFANLLLFLTCTDPVKVTLPGDNLYTSDEEYLSLLPLKFEITRDQIEEAIDNLSLLQIRDYINKSIQYVQPLKSEGETILWLVQFDNNAGWIILPNHVNLPPVIAHNPQGYFSSQKEISFDDLISKPGPAQLFSDVKEDIRNLKNGRMSNVDLAKRSHARWSILVADVPVPEDPALLIELRQSSEPGARTMAYEHLNMPWVHQMAPFNKFMPLNCEERCYIGSNNLAIGQVFKFYGKPDDKGWLYDEMTAKWGPEAIYIRAEVRQWAKMFLDIAHENQPDRICNANPDEPLWSDGYITRDYQYIRSFAGYKDLSLDSVANEEPGGWNIEDVYFHTTIKKQPSIVSAWGYAGENWYHHSWIIDGCERTGSPGNYSYEVHCLWGWEWDEISYNGWYNHDYMLGWDLYVSTITETAPDTTITDPTTYELWIDEMGFIDNCQTWIRIDDGDWELYPDETRIEVQARSRVYYRGESVDVEPENIRLIIEGPGGSDMCTSMSACSTAELSFDINDDVRIGIQALRWALTNDL